MKADMEFMQVTEIRRLIRLNKEGLWLAVTREYDRGLLTDTELGDRVRAIANEATLALAELNRALSYAAG